MVAPTKVLIVPLSAKEEFDPLIKEVCECGTRNYMITVAHFTSCAASKLRKAGVFSRVDDSTATIGKRYARNDELGTPFGLTLDFACMSPFVPSSTRPRCIDSPLFSPQPYKIGP